MNLLYRCVNVLPWSAKLHKARRVLVGTMSRALRAATSLNLLRQDLGGSFAAHARGLLASEFALLNSDGKEFGQLHLGGTPGAELGSGDYAASFEASGRRFRMVVDGEEVLSAGLKGRSLDELEISCGSRIYEVRIGFLRNLAVTTYQEGGEAVRLSGGLTGRNYEALFAAEDGCALPVAIFLLWHVAANRRRAYRTVSPTRGGRM